MSTQSYVRMSTFGHMTIDGASYRLDHEPITTIELSETKEYILVTSTSIYSLVKPSDTLNKKHLPQPASQPCN